jgi:hypothetical protein
MFIETTLNIRNTSLEKIHRAAQLSGKTQTEVIVILIKQMMNDSRNQVRCGKRVQYQDRNENDVWHIFHLQLRPDDYEYFLDLRKLLKMSVSLILTRAVEKYIKKLMATKFTDNYQYKNYIIAREVIDNVICWKLIWGYPYNIGAILLHT